ncbi:hypothetical protein ACWEPB_33715 [Kitasatospora cineracea]
MLAALAGVLGYTLTRHPRGHHHPHRPAPVPHQAPPVQPQQNSNWQ